MPRGSSSVWEKSHKSFQNSQENNNSFKTKYNWAFTLCVRHLLNAGDKGANTIGIDSGFIGLII